jgi:DNA repair protein RecN (Recombination protein N)
MLARLSIRDIVLIDQLDLEFSRGLTILTGETGAGKSILLDALSLALGLRGDGALVRAGATQGQVTAVCEPPQGHPVFAALAAQDADGRRSHARLCQRPERRGADAARSRREPRRNPRPA